MVNKESVVHQLKLLKIALIPIFIIILSSCTNNLSFHGDFQWQSCEVVYCESSENNKIKLAGLKLIEIAASFYDVELDLKRGFCEEYYSKREPASGYVYANKSAFEVCNEGELSE